VLIALIAVVFAQTQDITLVTPDGRRREFALHIPRFYNGSLVPLVFDSHGYTSNAEAQNRYTNYRDLADDVGFVVVHASGVQDSWNAGTCCGYAASANIDDVLFFRMMIDRVAEEVNLDRTRVFATGMSNGGFLSHRLGLEAADVFNAIGPVAATAPYFMDRPDREVGVYHIHGTDDNLVPYDGNAYFRSVEESTDLWRDLNGCGIQSNVTDEPDRDTECVTWYNCAAAGNGRVVTICTHGGGHTVPSYTAEKTWEFFASQAPLQNPTTPAAPDVAKKSKTAKGIAANAKEAEEVKKRIQSFPFM